MHNLLKFGKEEEALELYGKNKDILKWRNENDFNGTLTQWAAYNGCKRFLEDITNMLGYTRDTFGTFPGKVIFHIMGWYQCNWSYRVYWNVVFISYIFQATETEQMAIVQIINEKTSLGVTTLAVVSGVHNSVILHFLN